MDDYEDEFAVLFARIAVFFVGALCLAAMLACFGGCATSGRIGADAGAIRDSHTFIAGELEGAVAEFDRGIARAESHSRGIQDEIERLDYLFGQYEQAALRLRNEVDGLRAKVEAAEKNAFGGGGLGGGVRPDTDSHARSPD